jgi:hypothetical protein
MALTFMSKEARVHGSRTNIHREFCTYVRTYDYAVFDAVRKALFLVYLRIMKQNKSFNYPYYRTTCTKAKSPRLLCAPGIPQQDRDRDYLL